MVCHRLLLRMLDLRVALLLLLLLVLLYLFLLLMVDLLRLSSGCRCSLLLRTFLFFGCLIVEHAHFLHEFLLFNLKLLSSLFWIHSHLILVDKNLSYTLMTFTGERQGCYLLLVDFSPLDDLTKTITHVVELKVSTRLWTSVLIVWIIFKVDALIVHQVLLMIYIVCHWCCFISLKLIKSTWTKQQFQLNCIKSQFRSRDDFDRYFMFKD